MDNITKPPGTKLAVSILFGSSLIAVAIIISTALIYIWNQNSTPNSPKKIYENITLVKTSESPYLGNQDAPITIVEYIDFECPVCKRVYDDIYPQIKTEYINSGKVKFVFKSLPIEELHKTSFKKTEAAFCAYEQGGNDSFFAYHDSLFNNFPLNNSIDLTSDLTSIALQNKLDTDKFKNCLNSEKYKSVINKDIVESIAIDARGTPTWLIGKTSKNGITDTIKLIGLYKYSIYTTVLDQLLSEV